MKRAGKGFFNAPVSEMSESRKVHVLTCTPGQALSVTLAPGADPAASVGRLFADGDIDILVGHAMGVGVKLIVTTHPDLTVQIADVHY